MAKYRYRIEGGRYGGELVIGEVNPEFVRHYAQSDEYGELVDAVLETDDWSGSDDPDDALENPDSPPHPALPGEDFYMWENDGIEHLNNAYADGGFTVYQVPADGEDDYDYENEVYDGDAILVYSREGGYFSTDKEVPEGDDEYTPVLAFHSSEKGSFACWFVDTDEPFDRFKLGYTMVETNLCELVENVFYNKTELEADYDHNDTTGKSYDAQVGWMNMKWHDSEDKYSGEEDMKIYWEDFDDNVEYEKEQAAED